MSKKDVGPVEPEGNAAKIALDVPGADGRTTNVKVSIVERTQKLVILSVVVSGIGVGLQVLTHFKLF